MKSTSQYRDRAISLRKQGKSYSEIQKTIPVPKSTLSYWLRNVRLSSAMKKVLAAKSKSAGAQALIARNKKQTTLAEERAKMTREHASSQMKTLKQNDLYIAGIALYWGEGYKRGAYEKAWKCVDFTNSDPAMITVMMAFFRKCCDVPEKKFRIHLMLHNRGVEKSARLFWSKVTRIPLNQFSTTSFVVSGASSKKRPQRLPFGTVHVRIHDIALFFRLIGWIEGLQKQLKPIH